MLYVFCQIFILGFQVKIITFDPSGNSKEKDFCVCEMKIYKITAKVLTFPHEGGPLHRKYFTLIMTYNKTFKYQYFIKTRS